MRAVFSCGIIINLYIEDKAIINQKGKIECILERWKNPIVCLHVVEEVKKCSMLEEPGFHIKGTPYCVGPENTLRYDIYLSKEHFHNLTHPAGHPIVDGGYFISRSLYDRIELHYYEL